MNKLDQDTKQLLDVLISKLPEGGESSLLIGDGKRRSPRALHTHAEKVLEYMDEQGLICSAEEAGTNGHHLRIIYKCEKLPRMLKCLQN